MVAGQRQGSDAAEIVVVGAGSAGLAAALAAAQQDARVLLVEKTDAPGGNSALTTGIHAAGSRFQRAQGIEDAPLGLAEEIQQRNRGRADPVLIQSVVQDSAGVLEWMADLAGIEFRVSEHAAGGTVPRTHVCGGGWAFVRQVMAAAERSENIRVLWSTPVRSLQLGTGGAVTGIVTAAGAISAPKVILATGGFGGNREMLARYAPLLADVPYHGHLANVGDGHRMGIEAGGVAVHMDGALAYPCYFSPLHFPVPQPLIHMGAILVDRQGRRFADETKFPGVPAARILEMPGKCAYEIFDERVFKRAEGELGRVVQTRILERADSASDLAQRLGIEAAGLEQTIREHNSAAERGRDQFGRAVSAPLGTPLYGVRVWAALYTTVGGLRVNTSGQVLHADGTPIPNLYAAGDVTEGLTGPGADSYLPGNGQMAAIVLGKRAAEHAVASLRAAVRTRAG
ncbi:MAG: FAD-dependent oxidoreductase [Chloroflexi bacterium]|nr:FAD-dependent oxidoreductase [Chloroflexota bacterium]